MSSRIVTLRKRKTNTKSDSAVKKTDSKEMILKKNDTNDDATKPSLLILSNEKMCADDFLMKTRFLKNIECRKPDILVPKIKIRCDALDVEKIIDFENNKVVINKIKKIEKQPERNRVLEDPVPKTPCNTKLINFSESSGMKSKKRKSLLSSRKKVKKINKEENAKKLAVPAAGNAEKKKKPDITINKAKLTVKEESNSFTQTSNVEQLSLQVTTSENFKELLSENLNTKTLNVQGILCSSLTNIHEESMFLELSNINLEELEQSMKNISDEEIKMKELESKNDRCRNNENGIIEPNILMNSDDSTLSSDKTQSVLDQINYLKKTSLQVAVEAFMKNPQLNYLKENTALKRGLCFTWLSNNYVCCNQQCLYSHNALNLFTKKLKQYPSKFIMTVVVSMRNDILFVDVIMAAFKVLSERQIPMVWVTFLIYFVFYVTEPSDSRFLKFWANSARFFCQSDENYAAAKGFASLLSIFSQGKTSEEWKIVEFIKLIKQPPVQVPINYALLQPVLKINLPSQFLTEAIESSIATQKDVLKVQSAIIPKICVMTSPIQVVELLLKFSKTLEKLNYNSYADDLKQQLQTKMLTFKTKITEKDFPLTASFQEEINICWKEKNCFATSESFSEEFLRTDLESVDFENNYFEPGDDFCNLVTEAMDLSFDLIPSPYKNGRKSDIFMKNDDSNDDRNNNNREEDDIQEDVCERQVTRIQQFFRDCQFDSLAKYLNELRPNVIERAAEEFLKLSLNMKISLQQVVDLVKIIVLPCKSENAAKVIASISITFILNLVRINEWEKAYGIASICQKKKINLVEGKVFYFIEFYPITQCRIALLLIEIYAYKNDYASALDLVKKYNLFSFNNSFSNLIRREHDEIIRVRILEELLQQIISNQTTEWAFKLFELIWKEQCQLLGAIDLRKFVSDILILLLNQDSENAINLYEKIKAEVQLNETTIRAILVTLVRHNRLSSAKNLLLSMNQNVYFFPIKLGSVTIEVSSFWLEEEIYAVFDAFFDLLASKKQNFLLTDHNDLEIHIRISRPPNGSSCSVLRPLCLGIIKPSFKDACTRIQRVLSYQFNPPLKLIIMPYRLKLDECSVQLHLHKRMSRN